MLRLLRELTIVHQNLLIQELDRLFLFHHLLLVSQIV
jgi:hypothetical protein